MTLFDFIYFIGFGVALIMGIIFMGEGNENLPENQQSFGFVVFGSFACALLSWAVPIWWIGFEIYKKLIKQNKLKKENKNLYKMLDVLNGQLDTLLKEDKENQQLKKLLKECREFFEEENPKDFTVMSERMDELLTKITIAIGEK